MQWYITVRRTWRAWVLLGTNTYYTVCKYEAGITFNNTLAGRSMAIRPPKGSRLEDVAFGCRRRRRSSLGAQSGERSGAFLLTVRQGTKLPLEQHTFKIDRADSPIFSTEVSMSSGSKRSIGLYDSRIGLGVTHVRCSAHSQLYSVELSRNVLRAMLRM